MKELSLEQDIVQSINKKPAIILYDLPYVLLTEQFESIKYLVENSPVEYSFEMKESHCFPSGVFLLFQRLDD